MTRNQTSKRNLSEVVGIALFAVGAAVLVSYSIASACQFHAALNSSAVDSLGILGSIGLASLHAFRIMLDHAIVLSVVHRILVLCSALIVMLIGIALLPKRATDATTAGRRNASALPKGDQ
jgi:hypothetical protein